MLSNEDLIVGKKYFLHEDKAEARELLRISENGNVILFKGPSTKFIMDRDGNIPFSYDPEHEWEEATNDTTKQN